MSEKRRVRVRRRRRRSDERLPAWSPPLLAGRQPAGANLQRSEQIVQQLEQTPATRPLRRSALADIQQERGNAYVQRLLAGQKEKRETETLPDFSNGNGWIMVSPQRTPADQPAHIQRGLWGKVKKGAKKAAGSVKKGAKKAAGGVKKGAKAVAGGAKKVAGGVKKGVAAVGAGAKKIAGDVANLVKSGVKKVGQVAKAVGSKAAGATRQFMGWLKGKATSALTWLTKGGAAAWSWIKEQSSKALGGIREVVGQVAQRVKDSAGNLWNAAKGKAGAAWNWIKGKAGGLAQRIRGGLSRAWNWAKDKARQAGRAVAAAAKAVGQWGWNLIKSGGQLIWHWLTSFPERVIRLIQHLGDGVGSLVRWLAEGVVKLVRLDFRGLGRWLLDGILGGAAWVGRLIAKVADVFGLGEALTLIWEAIKINTRPMTGPEIQEAERVFGNSIDYKAVRIDENSLIAHIGKWLQDSENMGVVTFNTINFTREISPAAGNRDMAWLIHELVHVSQYQHVGSQYLGEAIHSQNTAEGYTYTYPDDVREKPFSGFNREQQGDVAADYYLALCGEKKSGEEEVRDVTLYEPRMRELQGGQL